MNHIKKVSFHKKYLLVLGFLALSFSGCTTLQQNRNHPSNESFQIAERQKKNSPQAIAFYLKAAQESLAIITNKKISSKEQSDAMYLYSEAIGRSLIAIQTKYPHKNKLPPAFFVGNQAYSVKEIFPKGDNHFQQFILASKVSHAGFHTNVTRKGLGTPLVGIQEGSAEDAKHRLSQGFASPITVVASFGQKERSGNIPVAFSFYDPRKTKNVLIKGEYFPLAADFTAPMALFLRRHKRLLGIAAMFRSDLAIKKSNIYFYEPYDPHKIPVLFVHGFISSPVDWTNFINQLNRDRYFRDHCQSWVFFYPTGIPILASAFRLRQSLSEIAAHYPLKKNIVLIGHSMGGLVAKMQVVNSGDTLWSVAFGSSGKAIKATLPEDSLLKKMLLFKANPYISRVIFISTPHQGSYWTMLPISMLSSSLVQMPSTWLKKIDPLTKEALKKRKLKGAAKNESTTSTALEFLSPRSSFLEALNTLRIEVPYYSIIGNRGHKNEPLEKSSDGIVPYWSSHLKGAGSECIVPEGHEGFKSEKAREEVLRILKLNAV